MYIYICIYIYILHTCILSENTNSVKKRKKTIVPFFSTSTAKKVRSNFCHCRFLQFVFC